MYGNWLYFLTPDNYFVSLDAATGQGALAQGDRERQARVLLDRAPIVVRNHVIIGVGGDSLDVPGYLESRDPETGELQWRWYTTPRAGRARARRPGRTNTRWRHGGGMPWLPGTYDPELNLYYFGTGNANPVLAGQSRPGDNLWTARSWPSTPTPARWPGTTRPRRTTPTTGTPRRRRSSSTASIDGKPRKLIAQANRNGHFFLLDRTNGKHILTAPFVDSHQLGRRASTRRASRSANPAKDASIPGTLVSPTTDGATNWPPPELQPRHRPLLRRHHARRSASST